LEAIPDDVAVLEGFSPVSPFTTPVRDPWNGHFDTQCRQK
jgi:hypothetical protein